MFPKRCIVKHVYLWRQAVVWYLSTRKENKISCKLYKVTIWMSKCISIEFQPNSTFAYLLCRVCVCVSFLRHGSMINDMRKKISHKFGVEPFSNRKAFRQQNIVGRRNTIRDEILRESTYVKRAHTFRKGSTFVRCALF